MLLAAMCTTACNTLKNMDSTLNNKQLLAVDTAAALGHRYIVMKPKAGTEVLTQSGTAPDVNDGSLLLSVAAAFTGDDLTTVCGDHVVAGTLHKGYADVTTTGHMLIVDGKVKILPIDIIHQSIKSATAHRGYLFQQCYIVENGVAHVDRIPQAIIDRRPHIIFRAAVLMADGSFAVVQGADEQYPEEFVAGIVQLGARDALYLDMGTWAYGWYRTMAGGTTTELAKRYDNTRFQSNWLIIRAKK